VRAGKRGKGKRRGKVGRGGASPLPPKYFGPEPLLLCSS